MVEFVYAPGRRSRKGPGASAPQSSTVLAVRSTSGRSILRERSVDSSSKVLILVKVDRIQTPLHGYDDQRQIRLGSSLRGTRFERAAWPNYQAQVLFHRTQHQRCDNTHAAIRDKYDQRWFAIRESAVLHNSTTLSHAAFRFTPISTIAERC